MDVYICPEMQKFRDALDAAKVPWSDSSCEGNEMIPGTCGTTVRVGRKLWSIINGFGTYGGQKFPDKVNRGFLEAWDKTTKNEPVGWLDAEEALKLIGIVPPKHQE